MAIAVPSVGTAHAGTWLATTDCGSYFSQCGGTYNVGAAFTCYGKSTVLSGSAPYQSHRSYLVNFTSNGYERIGGTYSTAREAWSGIGTCTGNSSWGYFTENACHCEVARSMRTQIFSGRY